MGRPKALTPQQVDEIRSKAATSTYAKLAEEYSVSNLTIFKVVNGKHPYEFPVLGTAVENAA